jgi:general secretion pathway protein N
MTWWVRGGALVLAFVIALAVMFPLRMAWDAARAPSDLTLGEASGTIWSGQLRGVAWRGVALGDFDASLSPLDLLPSPTLRLANGSGLLKSAMVRGDQGGFTLSDATIRLALGDIVAGAPADLFASITNAAVSLQGERCTHAAGLIEIPPAPAFGLPAFAGALACDRGVILARLSSEAGDAVLELGPGQDTPAYRSASAALQPALAALRLPPAPAPVE